MGASLRIGELCGLNWGDWDPEERPLRIERQYSLGEPSRPTSDTKTSPLLCAISLPTNQAAAVRCLSSRPQM